MDWLALGILFALMLLFGWLTWRAWKIRHGLLRWLALVPAALLTLLFALVLGAALNGYNRFFAERPNPVPPLTVAGTPEQVERGRTIARTCAGCHSPNADFPLVGQDFAANGPPLGTLWAPPLTASHFSEWSDGEIARAVREGVHKSGRSLLIMPAEALRQMSDEDVSALIAFIRTHDPETPPAPETRLSLSGALLLNVAPFQTAREPLSGPVDAPERGPTAEYGDYLLSVSGCRDCHGGNLAGVPPDPNGPPPGPNLTGVGTSYSEEQFIALFRSGMRADGQPLGPGMEWRDYELYTDDDFRAMYAYFQELPPLPDN